MAIGKKIFDWQAVESRDKETSAKHEAAHATVAQHFDIGWEAHLIDCGEATQELRRWRGQTCFDAFPPRTAFQASCIAWAGTLSQMIDDGEDSTDAGALAFAAADYRDAMGYEISATDERDISRHPQQWRACKMAARILVERRTMWEWIAARMLDAGTVDCNETAQEWTRAGKRRDRQNPPMPG